MKSLGAIAGALVALSISAGASSAAMLTFNGAGFGQNVNVATPTWNGFAGQIKMTKTSGPATENAPNGSFIAWCLDLTDYVRSGAFVEKAVGDTSIFDGGEGIAVPKQIDIQKYFDVNYGDLLTTIASAVPNSDKNAAAAAFQVGLWEIVYETAASYKTNSGIFSDTSSVTLAAQDMLDKIADWTTQKYTLFFWDSEENAPYNQELVSAVEFNGINPIPLPAAGWLLGAGLFGLLGIGRLKKASVASA